MDDLKPTEKVQAGLYSGAAAILALYVLQQLGIDLPAPVATAVGVLISGAGAWIKTEGAGWFRARKGGDHVRY